MSVVTSTQFTLNCKDVLLSLPLTALSGPVLILLTSLQAGQFNIDWTKLWQLAVSSAAGYLIKNFFTPAQTTVTPPAAQPGTTIPDASVKVIPTQPNKN